MAPSRSPATSRGPADRVDVDAGDRRRERIETGGGREIQCGRASSREGRWMVDAGGTWVARAARPERHAARPAERRRWRRHGRATARAQTGAVAERQRALAHLAELRKNAVEQHLEPARHGGARAAWRKMVRP